VAADASSTGTTVVLYDGVCGLCNWLTRFLLPRDRLARIRYAPIQSPFGQRTLVAHGRDPADLDTIYVIADWKTPRERLLERSRAVLLAFEQVGGPWAALARLGRVAPLPLADGVYRVIARTRYRLFGQFGACPVPPPEWRERFLDHG
jgi:predicted DCC family thiol-disulfide oxidoreductase YuxK